MLKRSAALAALAACIAAAPALAAPRPAPAKPHQIANNIEWFAVDGSRFAAWGMYPRDPQASPPGATDSFTVLDTRTHKRRRVKKSVHCTGNDRNARQMLDGWMLIGCDYSSHLINLRTGRLQELPAGGDYWEYLGKRWIEGFSGDDFDSTAYLNRRTGEIRRFSAPCDLFADPPVRDLDDPKLRVVCIDPGWFSNRVRFYDGRYAVNEPSHGPYRYELHRSCHAKGQLLTKMGEDVSAPFVDAGWVTWGKGGYAYGLNLATMKRRRWSVPHYQGDIGPPEVAQTSNTIFFAPPQTDDGTSAPAYTSYDLFAMRSAPRSRARRQSPSSTSASTAAARTRPPRTSPRSRRPSARRARSRPTRTATSSAPSASHPRARRASASRARPGRR